MAARRSYDSSGDSDEEYLRNRKGSSGTPPRYNRRVTRSDSDSSDSRDLEPAIRARGLESQKLASDNNGFGRNRSHTMSSPRRESVDASGSYKDNYNSNTHFKPKELILPRNSRSQSRDDERRKHSDDDRGSGSGRYERNADTWTSKPSRYIEQDSGKGILGQKTNGWVEAKPMKPDTSSSPSEWNGSFHPDDRMQNYNYDNDFHKPNLASKSFEQSQDDYDSDGVRVIHVKNRNMGSSKQKGASPRAKRAKGRGGVGGSSPRAGGRKKSPRASAKHSATKPPKSPRKVLERTTSYLDADQNEDMIGFSGSRKSSRYDEGVIVDHSPASAAMPSYAARVGSSRMTATGIVINSNSKFLHDRNVDHNYPPESPTMNFSGDAIDGLDYGNYPTPSKVVWAHTNPSKLPFVMVAHPRGYRTPLVQCTIIRDRSTLQSKVHPTYELILEETRKPLIIARKMTLNRTSNYHLFDLTRGIAARKLSKKNGNYLGKLRAKNSMRTEYILQNQSFEREELGAIVFHRMGLLSQLSDGNQPRKMRVVLPKLDSSAVPTPHSTRENGSDSLIDRLVTQDTMSSANYSVNDTGSSAKCSNKSDDEFLIYQSKDPVLENGNYRLNFGGRVTLPSVKNFQLVPENNINDIVCQFGKVDEDVFHLDYRYPLNAFQAFGLALCQFNL